MLTTLATLAALFFSCELGKELDPLSGFWEPEQIIVDGQPVDTTGCRVFLEVADGKASIADYWTCGVPMTTLASGRVTDHGQFLSLNAGGGPTTRIDRVENGKLAFVTTYWEGRPATIRFVRTENLQTVFDILGWR